MTELEKLAHELLASHPPTSALWLDFAGVLLLVRSSSRAVSEGLERYFGGLVTAPAAHADIRVDVLEAGTPRFELALRDWPREPGKVGQKERYTDAPDGRVIAKVRTGMFFVLTAGERIAVGPCLRNLNQVVNFIIAQYIGRRLDEGWSLCHAAAVSLGAEGLAIAARSGAGKSTLALHLMSAGLSFTSNDRLLIRRNGERCEALGVAKMPRVNPGTLLHNRDLSGLLRRERRAVLEALPPPELWRIEEKHDVMVGDIFGAARTRYRVQLRALLVLSWSLDAEGPARFLPVELGERPDLLERVMKSPGVFHRTGCWTHAPPEARPEPGAYLRALRGLLVYEATGRADFSAGVAFCRRLLEH
jgi:HprK-related kinase B